MSTATLRQEPTIDDSPREAAPLRVFRPTEIRLVVIIPALNEAKTIADVVSRVPREIEGIHQVDVVVVNDGSTDETAALARAMGAIVVGHPRPSGVGAAFQTGLRKAFEMGADMVLNIDGDGQFAPEDIPKLLGPLVAGDADFVTASRFKDPALVPKMPWIKKWGNRQVSRMISRMVGERFYDVSCGMRAYNRSAALSLSLMERFSYTHEAFLHLSAKRMRIVEVPLRVRGERQYGKSRVASNLFRYARNTLKIVFRFYRDYHPLRFFGWIAALLLVPGCGLLGLCLWQYATHGTFSPHKWAGFTGAFLATAAVASLLLGILGDMLNRQRVYLEEILYHARSLVSSETRRGP